MAEKNRWYMGRKAFVAAQLLHTRTRLFCTHRICKCQNYYLKMRMGRGSRMCDGKRVNHLSSYRLLFKRRFLEVLQRHLQSGFEVDLWFPAEQSFSFGDVRSALLGIVLRQGFVANIALGSGDDKHPLCTLQDGEFGWVSDVYRQMFACL